MLHPLVTLIRGSAVGKAAEQGYRERQFLLILELLLLCGIAHVKLFAPAFLVGPRGQQSGALIPVHRRLLTLGSLAIYFPRFRADAALSRLSRAVRWEQWLGSRACAGGSGRLVGGLQHGASGCAGWKRHLTDVSREPCQQQHTRGVLGAD